jgi:hypothetical protein
MLAQVPNENLVKEAMRLQKERWFDQGAIWRVFCVADPDRALLGLLRDADAEIWDPSAWRDMISAAAEKDDALLAAGIATSLVKMPNGPALELLPYSTTWLQRRRRETLDSAFAGPGLYIIWDRFADLVFGSEAPPDDNSERDPLKQFLGSLGGTLTSILIDELSALKPAQNSLLNFEFTKRFARIVACETASGLMGRLWLAREMAFLDWVDEGWVKEHLAPRFSWEHPEAALMWRSYSQGRLCLAPLFNALKPAMITALQSAEFQEHEVVGLTSNLLEIVLAHQSGTYKEYSLTTAELRRVLTIGPSEARRNVSWNLWHIMMAKNELPADKPSRWRDLIAPVFKQIWPLDANLRTEQASKNLAKMVLECETALPEAVDAVLDYLVPYQIYELSHSFSLDRLGENAPPQNIIAIVRLVGALVDPAHPLPSDFTQFLDMCSKFYPPISEHPAYVRLYGLRRRLNA